MSLRPRLPAAHEIVGNRQRADPDDPNADSTDSPMPIRTLLLPHYRRRNFEMLGFQPWRRRIVIVEPLARGSNPRYGVQLASARKLGATARARAGRSGLRADQ